MLSLSMSFLLWSWARSRAPGDSSVTGKKPAKKHGFGFSVRSRPVAERRRRVYAARTRESNRFWGRAPGVWVSWWQPNPCLSVR